MSSSASQSALIWPFGSVQAAFTPGASNGLRQAHLRMTFQIDKDDNRRVGHTGQAVQQQCQDRGLVLLQEVLALNTKYNTRGARSPTAQLQNWVKLMCAALTQISPILSPHVLGQPKLLQVSDARVNSTVSQLVLLWPTFWPKEILALCRESLDSWVQLSATNQEQQNVLLQSLRNQFTQNAVSVAQRVPGGHNPPILLAEATRLGIPAIWIERDVLQLGHGSRARWWRSTLTDQTSSLGVSLARDKTRTNRLLKAAALPTPRHTEVQSAEAAIKVAQTLGWPVVVKPADQDKGAGARADLHTPEQVRQGYEHALQYSKRVLVEQHIQGNEYRLTVVKGELLWAHERVPAMIVGDGQHNLISLIKAENQRRREALRTAPYGNNPIAVDAESKEYLKETGWTLASVPAVNQVVRLQRVPSAVTGGGGRAWMESIHPDNRQLAERAARLLRLDIAGVDLIMSDITQSWRNVGGAITEVNAIPQISMQSNPGLIEALLQRTISDGGRIPMIWLLAQELPPECLSAWRAGFHQRGLKLGLSSQEGMTVGDETYVVGRGSAWEHIVALQLDPQVDAMLLVSDGTEFLKTGLPMDRIDLLIMLEQQPRVMELVKPYCSGRLVMTDALSTGAASSPEEHQDIELAADQVRYSLETTASTQWISMAIDKLVLHATGLSDGA